jgi:hypothetical protein
MAASAKGPVVVNAKLGFPEVAAKALKFRETNEHLSRANSNLGANFFVTKDMIDSRRAPLISGSSLNLNPKEDDHIQAIILP